MSRPEGYQFSHVHGEEPKSESAPQLPKKRPERVKLTPEQIQFQKEAQAFVDDRKNILQAFAKDVSLTFKMGTQFAIDLEKGEVYLDTRWFVKKGFTHTQIFWALLHEVKHFHDLIADDNEGGDKKALAERTVHMHTKAKTVGDVMMRKWEETFGASNPDLLLRLKEQEPLSKKNSKLTLNPVEQVGFKFYHTFYNIFDDIHVNAQVSRGAPAYERGTSGGDEVERLYREKLFANTDYTKDPRHLQFIYKLIREEMVPGETVTVTPEVEEALSREYMFQGKKLTAKRIIEQFMKPKRGRDTKAVTRDFILKRILEPVFDELLLKDLEEWQPQSPSEKQEDQGEGEEQAEGDPNPFAPQYKDFADNSPDQIPEADMEGWQAHHDKEKKLKEVKANQTPEQRQNDAQRMEDKQWCEENKIEYSTLQKYREIEREIAPHLEELSRLWRHIIFGEHSETSRNLEGHYRTGTELDIPHLITHSPGVVSENPAVAVDAIERSRDMKRDIVTEHLVRKPELIRVRLVGDMSGSMIDAQFGGKKQRVLQQCVVLILSSLREFNTYLNQTRRQTKSKLEVDTETWVFGSDAKKTKSLRGKNGMRDEQVEIVRSFEDLEINRGGTQDHQVFEKIDEELTSEDRKKIAENKILDIVLEITDGQSESPELTRKAVDSLLDAGMVARAFQIGQVSQSEREVFTSIWNGNRSENYGEVVGTEVRNLIPAIVKVLKQYLGTVQL